MQGPDDHAFEAQIEGMRGVAAEQYRCVRTAYFVSAHSSTSSLLNLLQRLSALAKT